MFYGQNCSGRLGEKKAVICAVGSKDDFNFARLINELKLKNIKRELTEKHFSRALELSKKYNIIVSIVIIKTEQFRIWKDKLLVYRDWFARLYGIICYNVLRPILDNNVYLQMDREYDGKTLSISANVILELIGRESNIYIRKEREYPPNRIIVADLFARGCFKGFDCKQLIINKNLEVKNEIRKIFKNR